MMRIFPELEVFLQQDLADKIKTEGSCSSLYSHLFSSKLSTVIATNLKLNQINFNLLFNHPDSVCCIYYSLLVIVLLVAILSSKDSIYILYNMARVRRGCEWHGHLDGQWSHVDNAGWQWTESRVECPHRHKEKVWRPQEAPALPWI